MMFLPESGDVIVPVLTTPHMGPRLSGRTGRCPGDMADTLPSIFPNPASTIRLLSTTISAVFTGHVLTGKQRRSAIDGRTTRHEGYGISQSRGAAIECIFDYGKQHGTLRKTKHRGIASVTAYFLLNLIAYNLVRILKPTAA